MFGRKTLEAKQAELDKWEKAILKKDTKARETQWEWEDMCQARLSVGLQGMNDWWKIWKP